MRRKLTIQDLRDGKGKKQFTEVFTENIEEARALNDAGVDMIVTYAGCAREIRRAAPDMFMTVGMGVNDPDICSDADAIRAGFKLMGLGADAIYTGLGMGRVAAMADEMIPVVGHVGYVPYRSTWYGGARAIGKTADEALRVYEHTLAYEDAGALAVEMEIVPEAIATEISMRTSMTVISMGSGAGCDAQYLFAEDLIGTNTGHVPRHAKQYADLKPELARVQQMRVDAFKAFHDEVVSGAYPEKKHNIGIRDEELKGFLEGLSEE